MSVAIPLPLPVRALAVTTDGEAVRGELLAVRQMSTVTALTEPQAWRGRTFSTLSAAAQHVFGGRSKPGATEFVVAQADLPPAVVELCQDHCQRRRDGDRPDAEFVEVQLLLYLEYLLLVHFLPDPRAAQVQTERGPRKRKRDLAVKRTRGPGVLRLRSLLVTPDFRRARIKSERSYRHVVCLPELAQCSDALGPCAHPGQADGGRQLSCGLRNSRISAHIAGPQDVFTALWLPEKIRGNCDYAPDGDPLAVLPAEMDVQRWTAAADEAWRRLPNEARERVHAKWLEICANRCASGPELMSWWATEEGDARTKEACLRRRALVLADRSEEDDRWLLEILGRGTGGALRRVRGGADGDALWKRFMVEALRDRCREVGA